MEKLGIENVKVIVQKVKEIVDSAAVVMEDGKVGFTDIRVAPEMFVDLKDLVAAVKPAVEESKDLSSEEIKEILNALLDLGSHVAEKFNFKL